MQTFARGMALFQGDSPDVAVKGKAPAVQSAASNWKMFCHLFQACSAYAASIASKVQGRSVVTVETLRSIQVCADFAHSSIAVETLQRRLTLQQFRDMYALHAERMTLLLCEMEQAYPASSAEWAVGLAGLQSLCAAAQRLPQAMLGPILSTVRLFVLRGLVLYWQRKLWTFLTLHVFLSSGGEVRTVRGATCPRPSCQSPQQRRK